MKLPSDVDTTLHQCAQHLQNLSDPWWVIGSTAVALHGFDPGPINDIDILVSHQDAKTLIATTACSNLANHRSARFRSQYLFKPRFGITPVDIIAGLEVYNLGQWRKLAIGTRQTVALRECRIFVPQQAELIEILDLFGRKKDRDRAKILRR